MDSGSGTEAAGAYRDLSDLKSFTKRSIYCNYRTAGMLLFYFIQSFVQIESMYRLA